MSNEQNYIQSLLKAEFEKDEPNEKKIALLNIQADRALALNNIRADRALALNNIQAELSQPKGQRNEDIVTFWKDRLDKLDSRLAQGKISPVPHI